MLSLASVSFAYEPKYFDTSGVETKEELEMMLEDARYFEVTSPEMAVNLFTEALTEKDLVKMALLVPPDEFDGYKEWVMEQYAELDEKGFVVEADTEKLHPYGFYQDIENGSVTLTEYKADDSVEGTFRFRHANWTKEDGKWTEEFVSFRLRNEDGWRMYITNRHLQEFPTGKYYWEEDILHEKMQQGEYQQFGDWRFTMAEWVGSPNWAGDGFQGMHLSFFTTPTENAFSEEVTIFANHAVLVEYVGEMWPIEVWKAEKDKEVPVFMVCPAEMTDAELWENTTFGIGSGGSSSDGSAWGVPLIHEDRTTEFINGDNWCETIEEAMKELERPYEFRIYSQQGERLAVYPLEGGGLYD